MESRVLRQKPLKLFKELLKPPASNSSAPLNPALACVGNLKLGFVKSAVFAKRTIIFFI